MFFFAVLGGAHDSRFRFMSNRAIVVLIGRGLVLIGRGQVSTAIVASSGYNDRICHCCVVNGASSGYNYHVLT